MRRNVIKSYTDFNDSINENSDIATIQVLSDEQKEEYDSLCKQIINMIDGLPRIEAQFILDNVLIYLNRNSIVQVDISNLGSLYDGYDI